ncbi:MAG: methyltransferase domain-containing protein [Hyphomonas sp.]
MKKLTLLASAALLTIAACAHTPTETATTETVDISSAAISADNRSEEDRAKDETRKPAETLAFTGIASGDTVLEVEAGAGYFTTILSNAVGPEGVVYMQNPAGFDQFWGGGDPPRLATLPDHVTYVRSNFDDFSAVADASVDVVTWMQGPHEIWYTPEGAPGPLGDKEKTFSEIARVLKPGGTFIALDHAAPTGSPESTGGDTHRIDPNHIDKLAASKGLTKTDSSDIFANPDDNMLSNVFDPAIRGKTNQFLIKYTKS